MGWAFRTHFKLLQIVISVWNMTQKSRVTIVHDLDPDLTSKYVVSKRVTIAPHRNWWQELIIKSHAQSKWMQDTHDRIGTCPMNEIVCSLSQVGLATVNWLGWLNAPEGIILFILMHSTISSFETVILKILLRFYRLMTLSEKQQLQKLIQKLPPRNLDRVVEIIQRNKPSGKYSSGMIHVDLEKEASRRSALFVLLSESTIFN